MMPGVTYVIYVCSAARTTPEVSLYRSLTLKEKYCYYYYSDDNLKKQIKNQTLYTFKLFLLT